MNAEIIMVGTELLLGDIVDTNGKFIAGELARLGINLFYQTVVGDNRLRLLDAVQRAADRSDLVIFSGGLGPTADDITRETVSEALGLELEEDPATVERLKAFFAGKNMTNNNLRQAMVPRGAEVLTNDRGTAPGLHIEKDSKHFFLLPGPPIELEPMMTERVAPILARLTDRTFVSRSLKLYGIGESSAEDRLRDLMDESDPTLAPYAKTGEVLLRITSSGKDRAECEAKNDLMQKRVTDRVGEYVYSDSGETLEEALVKRFTRRGLKIATAESLTGGLISQRITSVPGASAILEMSAVTYCDRAKHELLGVKEATLKEHTAVSEETAAEMARGVAALSGCDVGVSATGYAGPSGEHVGLVYVGAFFRGETRVVRLDTHRNGCEREYIRQLAANAAIGLALRITGLFGYENK